MTVGQIKEDEANSLWDLYYSLPLMVDCGLITQAQADTLKSQINDELHEALGLT